jgi:hypothetical protein
MMSPERFITSESRRVDICTEQGLEDIPACVSNLAEHTKLQKRSASDRNFVFISFSKRIRVAHGRLARNRAMHSSTGYAHEACTTSLIACWCSFGTNSPESSPPLLPSVPISPSAASERGVFHFEICPECLRSHRHYFFHQCQSLQVPRRKGEYFILKFVQNA